MNILAGGNVFFLEKSAWSKHIQEHNCESPENYIGLNTIAGLNHKHENRKKMVSMSIHKAYLSPGTAFLGGRIGSTFSYVDAHISIPSEKIPRILAGFRLHITTTIRSRISPIGTNFTRPVIASGSNITKLVRLFTCCIQRLPAVICVISPYPHTSYYIAPTQRNSS